MQAKDYLKQAYRLNELIQSNRNELEELRMISESVSGIDYSKEMTSGGMKGESSFSRIVMKIIDLENAIKADIESMLSLKLEIRTTINTVKDNDEKLLLKLRYLNFMQWENICDEMGVSVRTAHRIHADALKNIVIP